MRLIMQYSIGDNCTWGATETLPIEYKSKEDAEYDFLMVAEHAHENNAVEFMWQNLIFNIDDFYDYPNPYDNDEKRYFPPTFFTIDEYFEAYTQ